MKYDEVEVGQELSPRAFTVRRVDLVKYAGASGDFNPIHWNEAVATSVGLPDVIAHGMFTMAQAGRYVTDWAGDPGALVDLGVRFSSMVVVPNDGGAEINITGVIEKKLEDNAVVLALTVRSAGEKVLTRAKATVRLP
jgi:acyl dehydratase